ncbi:MAG: hypothetical protein PHV47_02600 [Candidatus Pacebacteria bacterium]|nr:hypothetical protein [Candidatus Paceibacterota bacterium]MDD5621530.1 hypothetical protein [Candidatus Paceibacterota bacterium]
MDKDYSELIQFLGEKFDRIDDKFDRIDDKFDNVDEKFIGIDKKLDYLMDNKADKADLNNLTNAVDAYAKKADTYFQEMVMLSHKVDRIEKWVVQLADKAGLKLQY